MLNQLTILKVSSMLLSFTYAKSVNILKVSFTLFVIYLSELQHNKTNKIACAPSICPVRSESSLSACPELPNLAHNEDYN